jgi:hypothetical protein
MTFFSGVILSSTSSVKRRALNNLHVNGDLFDAQTARRMVFM